MAINIGAAAIGRPYASAVSYTTLLLDNPANEGGIITDIEIWADSPLVGVKVGTFYGTAPNYTCRAYAVIGDVAAGSKQSFSGLSIACEVGDLIGIHGTSGGIEWSQTGYAGIYYKHGDQFETGEQTYTLGLGDAISLYGFSAVVVGRSFGFIMG